MPPWPSIFGMGQSFDKCLKIFSWWLLYLGLCFLRQHLNFQGKHLFIRIWSRFAWNCLQNPLFALLTHSESMVTFPISNVVYLLSLILIKFILCVCVWSAPGHMDIEPKYFPCKWQSFQSLCLPVILGKNQNEPQIQPGSPPRWKFQDSTEEGSSFTVLGP